MENVSNLSVPVVRKSRSSKSTHETSRSNSMHQNRCSHEGLQKTSSTTPKNTYAKRGREEFKVEIPLKTEELNDKRRTELERSRRPSTASGATSGFSRNKRELSEKEWYVTPRITIATSPSQSRNSWSDRGSLGSNRSLALSFFPKDKKTCYNKNKVKAGSKCQLDFIEDVESVSLLSLVVCEQEEVTEMLQRAKDNLRKKLIKLKEENDIKLKPKRNVGDFRYKYQIPLEKVKIRKEEQKHLVEHFYSNNLDEVLQAWIHLFYFIINLRINLIRIVNLAGTESFKPNPKMERNVITRAVKCVKLFSKLKIKSLLESIEDHFNNEPKKSQTTIKTYEDHISSPFLLEMEYMSKKAKELLSQSKEENEKKIVTE